MRNWTGSGGIFLAPIWGDNLTARWDSFSYQLWEKHCSYSVCRSDVALGFSQDCGQKKTKKQKKHEQQSASAAVPSMATIKDKSQKWPMNRRRESNNVRGVGWWAGAEIRWRDLDEVKILSRWFRFFLCPWWPSAQGQAHSWRATDSWHQWHQKAAALYHNWPAAPILVHHMTLTSSSYPYSQGDITASLGWMWECEVLLCAKNIVLCVAVTCYRPNETEGCTRLLWLFNCRKSWCSLNRSEVTSSLLTLVTTSGSSQSNIKNSKSPIWTLDWTVWTEIERFRLNVW